MKAYIVVGLGYGDEGKGLTTDWLCAQALAAGERVVVVRANGGTQAAHTVQTPEGDSHVFHHHGSGGFLGVPTYLSQHFLVNPIGWRMERDEMPALAATTVYCSDQAQVSLPVDMMLNQLMEERRGGGKHGSCGWGIGETVQRGTDLRFLVNVGMLRRWIAAGQLGVTEIYRITANHLRLRLPELGVVEAELSAEWQARLHDGNIIERWVADAELFCAQTQALHAGELDLVADTLVFEGAQGLGLDQAGEHFPHVTRSYTGSTNPLEVLAEADERGHGTPELVEVVYVTRAYATRHGAGPLEHEGLPHGCNVYDPTNVPNQWQGALRSAPLDVDLAGERMARDMLLVLEKHPKARPALMMTCLDQATAGYKYHSVTGHPATLDCNPEFAQGRIMSVARLRCYRSQRDTRGMRFLTSSGPSRADVTEAGTTTDMYADHLRALLRARAEGGSLSQQLNRAAEGLL